MSDRRRSLALVALAVLAVAVAARALPLYWSPLPSTLDGIGYAAQARDALALGEYPLAGMRADNFGFVGLLVGGSAVTGSRPLVLAQPLVAIAGGASCLLGLALVRRLGRRSGLSTRGVRIAVLVAGFALALEGLYLRRTGVPDEEALAFLLLPVLAFAMDRALVSKRRAWLGLTLPLLVLFPLHHTFSTLMAALTLTGVFAIRLAAEPTRRRFLLGVGVVGGFWLYFVAYYELARRTVLLVPYVGRVASHPGLFVAWLVVLVAGVVWFRSTSDRARRASFLLPVLAGFAILVANAFVPVFPGTVPSPPPLVLAILALLVPVAFAAGSVPSLARPGSAAVVLLALLAAPVVHTYFSLTAELTPEFFGTVMRTQTFAHLPVLALAALAAGHLLDRDGASLSRATPRSLPRSSLRAAVVLLLVASILLTTPVAFVDLDTLAYPSTTTESEFAIAGFAATHLETWSSDHVITRIAGHYFDSGGAMGPTAAWLRGGRPPACAVAALDSWTETGAHFFPAPPETIEPERYEGWVTHNHRVYVVGGYDPGTIVLPRRNGSAGCR